MTDSEHIGVEIFKLLKKNTEMTQKEMVTILHDMGYSQNKIFIYIKYILTIPIPISKDEIAEPMIIRDVFTKRNCILLKLNNYWRETDVKAVKTLFDVCNPDKY